MATPTKTLSGLILVVEDEKDLAHTLEYNLRQEGFTTKTAHTGADGLKLAQTRPIPDLVLLDLMLPDCSGTAVCRALKEDENTRLVPIIMLTAKSEEVDRIVGFELGADDYVSKPFSIRELMLRIHAVLRRNQSSKKETPSELVFGSLTIDTDGHRAYSSGQELSLTALEFRLLMILLNRPGRAQTREQLLEDVWGITADVSTRTVDTHVKRLRQKMGSSGHYIETLRGVGYRFVRSPDDLSP